MLAFSVLSPAVTALLGMVAISALPAPRGTPDVFSLDDLLAIVSKTAKGVQFDKNGRTQPFCSLEGKDTALTGNLTLPHGLHATEVVIASGIQNYTCSEKGEFEPAGALADFYDASCLVGAFDNAEEILPQLVIEKLDFPSDLPFEPTMDHFFIQNPDGTISPVFKNTMGDRAEFVGRLINRQDAPNDPEKNIPWIELEAVSGDLAKIVFRVNNAGGQPPKGGCDARDTKSITSVRYSALYWFYN